MRHGECLCMRAVWRTIRSHRSATDYGWDVPISGGHDLARHLPDRIRAGGGLVADVPVHTLTRLVLVQKFVARPLKILSSDHDLS